MYKKKWLGIEILNPYCLPKWKIPLSMKFVWILVLAGVFQVSASTFAQNVSIQGKDMRLSVFLKEIERQSGYNIFYEQGLVSPHNTVDVNFIDTDAIKALNIVLPKFNLGFKTMDNNIVLVRKKDKEPSGQTTGEAGGSFQQTTIRGSVRDSTGSPLPGVTVRLKESALRTVSNGQGLFVLRVDRLPAVLEFSSVGYEPREVTVSTAEAIAVTMAEKVSDMDEVVVIGFGEVKKKDLTGSVVNIKMEDIQDAPVLSVDLALQGRVPGADIMASTGEPGAPASIRIRGTRSITATNEPLIVIDGVIDGISNLADINTADIESISVLKDASATAIYGTRGSNGVIIITTKQGRKGKDDIALKSTFGISQLPRKLDIMDASQFAQYRNDFAYFATTDNFGAIGPETPQSQYPFPDPLSMGKGTDWVDEITRIAPYHNQILSLSGGGNKTTHYASVTYDNTRGIIDNSGVGRFTGRLNLDYQMFPWMKVGYKYNYTRRSDDQNVVTIGGTNWWNAAIYLNPLIKTFDNFNDLWYSGQRFNSPRALLDLDVIRNVKRNGSTNTGYIDIQPIDGLKINSQLTYYNYQQHTFRYDPGNLPAKSENEGGMAYRAEYTERNIMSQTTANYIRKWGDNHVDMMVGFIGQQVVSDNFSLQGEGYQSDAIRWNNMNAIPDKENYSASTNNVQKTSMSFLARANYNYKSKYYLTVTGRQDGASNFAADRKWAFFPSAALKWTVSNEPFMESVGWVDDLSVRLSAGRTGNDGISSYRSLAALTSTTNGYLFDGSQPVAFYPSRLASEQLSWEKTDMYNAATDIALFNNRVNITLEGYLSYTHDLLLDVQTPRHTGYNTRFANVGRTSNKGIEFSIESQNVRRQDFSWSTMFSISHNQQMVEDIGIFDFVNVYGAYGNNSYMMYGYVQGYPLNALWGFQYAGTWKSQEEIERNRITRGYVSAANAQYAPGSPRYIDINHDGVFNERDQIYLGSADPFVYGGIQNNFNYKNLSLGVFVAYNIGGKIYNISEQWMGNGSPNTNQYTYMLNAWHPVRNPHSDIPRAGSNDGIASDRMVYDASFVRLKTVALGYNWNISRLTNNKLRDIQFTLAGENLLLWKKYNGFDPDVSSQSSTSTLRRVDIGAYPKPRTIVASVQIRY
ncbi:TonB-linked outer membrane protein, SusC/RagA family [Parapedobacter composti]|uniref:TonB-linked outer membrane protein, SusC/RagA family n=2 Tax=Parapedobacter composti TaxID=623281 RepID=A0A1I1LLG5_9SPHI|nr:TonB-linked outer membrane protein, SusC/RagA family [Parapedobacter composti]